MPVAPSVVPPPRLRYPSAKFILRGQTIGFSALLALMWIAELLHLPQRFFGDSPDAMWQRLGVRSFSLVAIWLTVHVTTVHLLRRLHELETFLRVCSWCRKVEHDGAWATMEDYFSSRFQTDTTHGICPDCMRDQMSRHMVARKVVPGERPARDEERKNETCRH